jgi:hypothetical protein
MEDDVYLCGWTQSPDGFELWVKARPRIRARGATYLAAEEGLLDAIAKALGVYFAVLEFIPPLPQSEFDKKYSTPELYTICGDDRFETDEPRRVMFETEDERAQREPWYDKFFVAPFCRDCWTPGGPRNESKITLTHVRSSYDGGFVLLANAWLRIFSERFLELLSSVERERLQFRLVDRSKRSRKTFFELIGPCGPPLIALAGRPVKGWRCPTCGARVFGYDYSPDVSISSFIAKSDLPAPLPQIFTIGTQPNVELCVTAQRWATMVDQSGTRGFVSGLLGVVPDDEVVRTPDLELRDDSR